MQTLVYCFQKIVCYCCCVQVKDWVLNAIALSLITLMSKCDNVFMNSLCTHSDAYQKYIKSL